MGKKEKTLLVLFAVTTLLIIGTLTYGFISAGVSNTNKFEGKLKTGTMSLTFADKENSIVARQLALGGTLTKEFTITNTGTLDASASIKWKNLVNTYMEGNLVYKLSYATNQNGPYTVMREREYVPRSETPADFMLYSNIVVPASTTAGGSVTHYYKLEITLMNYNYDQSEILNARMSTNFEVVEGITESEKTLKALGLTSKFGTPNFEVNAGRDETSNGLYSTIDHDGTSYYFRGSNVANNYFRIPYNGEKEECFYIDSYEGNAHSTKQECIDWYNNADLPYEEGQCVATCYCEPTGIHYNDYLYDMEFYAPGEQEVCSSFDDYYTKDMMWQIVRITGEGDVELAYTGQELSVGNIKSVTFSTEMDGFKESVLNYIDSYLTNVYQMNDPHYNESAHEYVCYEYDEDDPTNCIDGYDQYNFYFTSYQRLFLNKLPSIINIKKSTFNNKVAYNSFIDNYIYTGNGLNNNSSGSFMSGRVNGFTMYCPDDWNYDAWCDEYNSELTSEWNWGNYTYQPVIYINHTAAQSMIIGTGTLSDPYRFQ